MAKRIDLNFFPGFKRKAISFTIDDGNLKLDEKFISYVKPAGIVGTFNLVSSYITPSKREAYQNLYRDYEIANHQKYHPMWMRDSSLPVAEEEFNPDTADKNKIYKTGVEGLYYYCMKNLDRWFKACDEENYLRFVEDGKRELEEIFGVEIKDFVWPYGRQPSPALAEGLKNMGYRSVRGVVYDGFDLPEDRMNWGFYATYKNMLERAEEFERLSDDGKLKAFIFGVHAHDFENAGRWDVLEDFCKLYGNRENDFYYARVGEIFDCEDAIKAATVSETEIKNNSSIPLYAEIDGERVIIAPLSSVNV